MTGLSTICNITKSILAVHMVFLQMEFAVGCGQEPVTESSLF